MIFTGVDHKFNECNNRTHKGSYSKRDKNDGKKSPDKLPTSRNIKALFIRLRLLLF